MCLGWNPALMVQRQTLQQWSTRLLLLHYHLVHICFCSQLSVLSVCGSFRKLLDICSIPTVVESSQLRLCSLGWSSTRNHLVLSHKLVSLRFVKSWASFFDYVGRGFNLPFSGAMTCLSVQWGHDMPFCSVGLWHAFLLGRASSGQTSPFEWSLCVVLQRAK